MNSSLTSLYRKGLPESNDGPPAAGGPADSGTLVSTGGWFIDRGRGPGKSNILIDLCDEEPTDASVNQVTIEPSSVAT